MLNFEPPPQLLGASTAIELAKRLGECDNVRRFDDPNQPEAEAIADALGDLEKVFRKYLDELLPSIVSAKTCDQLDQALFDIRLEFQEIVWHLWYPKSFRVQLLGEDCAPPWIDARLRP